MEHPFGEIDARNTTKKRLGRALAALRDLRNVATKEQRKVWEARHKEALADASK